MATRLAINPSFNDINEVIGWFDPSGIEPLAGRDDCYLWHLETGEWVGEIRSFGKTFAAAFITSDEALRWMILHGFSDEVIDAHFPGTPRQFIPGPRDA